MVTALASIVGICAAAPAAAQATQQPPAAVAPSPQPPAQPAETRPKDRPTPTRRPDAAPAGETRDGEAAMAAECAWVGKRIVSLLVRDDAMAAGDFLPFYLRFRCPEEQIGKAFGCIVRTGEATPNEILAERIDQCWSDPDVRFPKLQKEPPAETPAAPAAPPKPGGGN
jgi:hypothetical protein